MNIHFVYVWFAVPASEPIPSAPKLTLVFCGQTSELQFILSSALNISTDCSMVKNIGETFICITVIHQNGRCTMDYKNTMDISLHLHQMFMAIITSDLIVSHDMVMVRSRITWLCSGLTLGMRLHHVACLVACWYNVTAASGVFR